jgi:DNA-binding transcriptional regulator/RsmH inhibitor MraZ
VEVAREMGIERHELDLHSGLNFLKAAHSRGRGQTFGLGAFPSALSQPRGLQRQGLGGDFKPLCYTVFMAGRWEIKLSAEGRLKLRKPFVSENERVFLTKHVNDDGDCYLLGLSPRVWPRLTAEVNGQQGEGLKAFYLETAAELKIGSDGTIVIPQPLRDFAGLKRRVTLVEMKSGVDEFWLWNPEVHNAALDRAFDALVTMKW